MNEFVLIGIGVLAVGLIVTFHATGVIDVWGIIGLSATLLGAVFTYLSLDRSNESALSGSTKVDENDRPEPQDPTETNPDPTPDERPSPGPSDEIDHDYWNTTEKIE